jgi:hypothetical protein
MRWPSLNASSSTIAALLDATRWYINPVLISDDLELDAADERFDNKTESREVKPQPMDVRRSSGVTRTDDKAREDRG